MIDAFQLPGRGVDDVSPFLAWCEEVGFTDYTSGRDETLVVVTLEGDLTAQPGDWIIKGVAGEFYPCKPEIFAQTYEPVEGAHD